LVEFSGELEAAEAPVIQQEALIFQAEPLIFQAEAPVDCPKPWDLGVESVESARIFLKQYTRDRERIMRDRAREEKRVQNYQASLLQRPAMIVPLPEGGITCRRTILHSPLTFHHSPLTNKST